MSRRRLSHRLALTVALAMAGVNAARAQETAAIGHAARVLDLLGAGKFDEVAAEFNAKMTAAMPASQLRNVWTAVRQQVGALTSIIDQRVVTQPTGNLTVVTACQF